MTKCSRTLIDLLNYSHSTVITYFRICLSVFFKYFIASDCCLNSYLSLKKIKANEYVNDL